MTGPEAWALAWPLVPWEDASPEDQRLFRDHASSLSRYIADKEVSA